MRSHCVRRIDTTLLSNRGYSNNGFSAFKKDYAKKDDKKITGSNSIVQSSF